MAFFNNKRKDFSIQPPRQQVDGTPFFVTDSANIDFTLLNLNLTANLTQLLPTSGTYGSPTLIPILEIDQWGRITGVSTTTFSASGILLQTNDVDNISQVILNLKSGTDITVTDNGDGSVSFDYIGTSGVTASEGLKINPSNPNDVQLGSATDDNSAKITNTRYISIDPDFSLKIKGTLNDPFVKGVLNVENIYTSASVAQPVAISGISLGNGVRGFSSGSYPFSAGVYGEAIDGYGILSSSINGIGVKTFSTYNTAFLAQRAANLSQAGSIVEMAYYFRQTIGSPGINGVGMKFTYDIAGGISGYQAHEIVHKWVDVSAGTQLSQYEIWGNRYGTLQQHFTLKGTGQLQLNNYGVTPKTFAGTTVWFLAVNSSGDVIEVEAPTGTGNVTGSGTATRVAYWSGANAISDDSSFYWDNTNKALAIGASASPSAAARLYLFSSTNNADVFIESIFNQRLKFKNTTTGIQWHTSTNTFGDIDSYNIGQSSNPSLGYLEILKSGRVKIGANIAGTDGYTDTTMLELGLTGVRGGQMILNALTSGNITLKATDTTTPYTFTFPDKPSTADLFLKTDASGNTSWATGGGGGSTGDIYYLNGSVPQGTISGIVFQEMNKIPVIGGGTDYPGFNTDGYIASFVTDPLDPSKLLIPAGNWNFEMWFSANNAGGSPRFYIEVYKLSSSTLTWIASNIANPEFITNGAVIDLYTTAVAMPTTLLSASDRIAIRVYVIHSSKIITLHTEGTHLCQVTTTFASSGGITELTTDVTTPAASSGVTVATLAANYKKGSTGVVFDGADGVIAANTVAYVQVPYSGTITAWTIVSKPTAVGTCTVTPFKLSSYPPTTPTDNIFNTQPALTGTAFNQDLTPDFVLGKDVVTAGDWIGFRITVPVTVTWVNLTLSITKTV